MAFASWVLLIKNVTIKLYYEFRSDRLLPTYFGQADSGSPLLYVEDGKQYTVGIVSWGVPCAAGFPDVFVRVFPFADWIETTILESLETVVWFIIYHYVKVHY